MNALFSEFSELDTAHMRRAIELAWLGRFSTSPNPRVGCVIAHGGQIVGQGFHVQAGFPHAEVHALRQAGDLARGATAYVTLEPCSHHGRTPPCAEGLIAAGVARVVIAMGDPNPLVASKGIALLQAAGISVQCGLLADEARALNRGFLSRIERRRPFVSLKIAASLDGKTALSDGRSQWITGEEARADVQRQRAQSCAVLTGIGTVLHDNPRLNVRQFPTVHQPLRVILDSRLRTPESSRMIQDGQATQIFTLQKQPALFAAYPNVSVRQCAADTDGRIALPDVLAQLAEDGIGELMVEAGCTLNSAFLQQNLADEIVYYQSAKILGSNAQAAFSLPENPAVLQQNAEWQTADVQILGKDIKWTLRRAV